MNNQNLIKNTKLEENTSVEINSIQNDRDLDTFDYQQRLIKNYLKYVEHTGDCSYLKIFNENEIELEKQNKTEQKKCLSENQDAIEEICLSIKELLENIAQEKLDEINSESVRSALEGVSATTKNPYLITELNDRHYKLGQILSHVINIGKKYEKQDKVIDEAIKDLTYFHKYIKYHAQPTKLKNDLIYITDSKLYLHRLNSYLDNMITTTNTLVNAIDIILNSKEEEITK